MSRTEVMMKNIIAYLESNLPQRIDVFNQRVTDKIILRDFSSISLQAFNPFEVLESESIIHVSSKGGRDVLQDCTRSVLLGFAFKNHDPGVMEIMQIRYTDLLVDSIMESNRFNRTFESIGEVNHTLYGGAVNDPTLSASVINFTVSAMRS